MFVQNSNVFVCKVTSGVLVKGTVCSFDLSVNSLITSPVN